MPDLMFPLTSLLWKREREKTAYEGEDGLEDWIAGGFFSEMSNSLSNGGNNGRAKVPCVSVRAWPR